MTKLNLLMDMYIKDTKVDGEKFCGCRREDCDDYDKITKCRECLNKILEKELLSINIKNTKKDFFKVKPLRSFDILYRDNMIYKFSSNIFYEMYKFDKEIYCVLNNKTEILFDLEDFRETFLTYKK